MKRDERDGGIDPGLLLIGTILLMILLAALAGCANTAAAVAELPEGYWTATGALLVAIGKDTWDFIQTLLLFFPILI